MNVPTVSPGWALVAGGSGGIGGATARLLAEDGWDVVLSYHRNADRAEKAADAVRELGRRARVLRLDLTDPEHTAETVRTAA
ncbi:MAG: 3-oxoacyl-[acyl-carrier protein] reductase, partial [Pseudonocardiales bacterium]|nr:3-oxoacyl-[acyl-carrier protein] reductase [Pseudonocardiales bacterium]